MRKLSGIEDKILDKTLYLIGKTGSFDVPIRLIAKEAGVNVGAINYYFRTKEDMMLYVKKFYIDNMVSAYGILDNKGLSVEDRLILSANEIMEYTLKYPGIFIILKEAKDKKDINEIDSKIVELTEEMNNKLYETLNMIVDNNKYNKMIFVSSILYPTILFDIDNWNSQTLEIKEDRIDYIKFILSKLKDGKD